MIETVFSSFVLPQISSYHFSWHIPLLSYFLFCFSCRVLTFRVPAFEGMGTESTFCHLSLSCQFLWNISFSSRFLLSTAPETEQAICRLLELAKFLFCLSAYVEGYGQIILGNHGTLGYDWRGTPKLWRLRGGNGILTSRLRGLITATGRLIGWSMMWMPFGF